ncbi:synaptotagmin-like protein 4 isoform X6 [Drosophila hydei]|uniref:Synaptotagmin-like protein 4 isoform X6 n=1 Tax=Drosophila hydei TaxID=7224 RepID=A0A6J1M691_DROHY|nr:synaptotagmin-like protein 4 isoform X6 [Drosophila hydei]
MRKVTRLIGKRGNNTTPKDATGYNEFVRPSRSKPPTAAIVSVHNYGKAIKSAATGVETNPAAGKIQYAALNRLRNSSQAQATPTGQTQRRWQRLCWCWRWRRRRRRQRSYKNYWRSGGATKSKWSSWWRWGKYCCHRRRGIGSYHYDSEEEEDDIDAKVAAYILEMKQREAVASRQSEQTAETAFNQATDETAAAGLERSSSAPPQQQQQQQLQPAICLAQMKRRAWTWDDSLRSNSDRFLETLEEDLPGAGTATTAMAAAEAGLRLSLNLQRRTPLHVTFQKVQEEAKAAADELSQSPVIGQRNPDAAASSPIQSRASSETWPPQSDEDIDRLVAMHQNRSSLSSLGVRSESMASVYSGAGEGRYGTVVVKGQVEFGMQYNYKLGALEIHVVRCKDLAAVDAKRNRSDPYVKVYLLPDKSKAGKRKTKVKKHTLNPIFDETLRFHTSISSLESKTLWLTVWHSDMFGRNDFLGEVSVNLQGRLFDNPQSQWYLLQERSEPFDDVATYRGDIVVGLKYIPPESLKSSIFSRGSSLTGSSSNLRKFGGSIKSVTSKSDRSAKGGQLHVLVKEAKHLSPIKTNGTCDAFCKSYLLPDRTRSSKQKTPVVKRTLHPSWNYTFVYEDVSQKDLSERALELTVWDHDRLASNEFVGGIRFSLGTGRSYGRQVDWMDATGKELSLWQNMLDRPNFWVEGSLVLRSTLDGIRSTLP